MKDILIIGGKGNGTVIAATIEDLSEMKLVGFLNDEWAGEIDGYPILGAPEDWEKFPGCQFIFALLTVKVAKERISRFLSLGIPKDRMATVIHPTAVVSKNAEVGHGVVLMPLAHAGPGTKIGDNSQMYALSYLGHDSTLLSFVFVSNQASIGADIIIQTGVHIGSNSSIREHVIIGEYAVIGLGSVVLNDVAAGSIVVGNPAREIAKN